MFSARDRPKRDPKSETVHHAMYLQERPTQTQQLPLPSPPPMLPLLLLLPPRLQRVRMHRSSPLNFGNKGFSENRCIFRVWPSRLIPSLHACLQRLCLHACATQFCRNFIFTHSTACCLFWRGRILHSILGNEERKLRL